MSPKDSPLVSPYFKCAYTVGAGEAGKGDLCDKESKGCSCVLLQSLASKSNHLLLKSVNFEGITHQQDSRSCSRNISNVAQVMAGYTGTLSTVVDAFIAGRLYKSCITRKQKLIISHNLIRQVWQATTHLFCSMSSPTGTTGTRSRCSSSPTRR